MRHSTGLLSLILIVALAPSAAVHSQAVVETALGNPEAEVTIRAEGRGTPYFSFRDGRAIDADARGDQALVDALRSGAAQPRALASADVDRNGTPDVVASYGSGGGGIVTLQRGNPDAFAPADDSVFPRLHEGYDPPSLLPDADVFELPTTGDFLVTGNFDGDAQADIIAAASGGDLYLMAGDGRGGFEAARKIALPGVVTALTAGEFRAADGFADIAVGVAGPEGARLLIFDDPSERMEKASVAYPLNAPATAVQFGMLDDDPFTDVAVAAGPEAIVMHGWGRKHAVAPASRVERIGVNRTAQGLALGEFVWDRQGRSEIAVVTDDGAVRIFHHGTLDTRPFTDVDARRRGTTRLTGKRIEDIESVESWQSGDAAAARWRESEKVGGAPVVARSTSARISRAHLSFRETDDLIVLDGSQPEIRIVRQNDRPATLGASSPSSAELTTVVLGAASVPLSVLPLRQKLNGVRDLLVLSGGSSTPIAVPLAPTVTITVDRTDDPSGAALTLASACIGLANDCSLRGAIQFANANPGTAITLGTFTYTLNINGAGGCINESPVATGNTRGDLEINQSTTITGAGAASTIIRQTGTGDRVMCLNALFLVSLQYNFSGITITGGRESTGFGGGGIIGGELSNSLTLTNVTISNNQVANAGIGGGGIQITGGDLTITNSTIGGTNAPGADRNDVTLANHSFTSGGGVMYTPSSPMHAGGTGLLTVTGSTFTRNTAASICCGGGGADLVTFAFAAPGGIGAGSASFATSSFVNNQATAANGGAIIVESLATTVATTPITNNSAGNRGGAIYVGGASLLLDGTSASVSMTGNTATIAGSSVSTASAVTVSGTNVTLGGDIEITTNGSWTNNSGSTVSPTNVVLIGGTFNANNSTTNIGGNLSIGPGAIVGGAFNAGSAAINVAGNMTVTSGGAPATTFTAGTSTFTFNGGGAQSIGGTLSPTFNNLTVAKSAGTLTLGQTVSVASNLTVSSGTFDLSAFTANRTAPGGTLTVASGPALNIGGSGTLPSNFTAVTLGAASTVSYYGGGAQTIAAANYGNLTSSGAGARTLASSGTIGVAGTFTPGSNVYTITGSTVNFNGSGAQTIPAFNYSNLTSSSTGTRTLASSGTVGVAALFAPGTNAYTVTGSTVQFNGSGAQAVPIFTYNNLTLNNAAGTTAAGAFSSLGLLRTQAGTFTGAGTFTNVQIDGATTLTSTAAATTTVAGSWTNNGSFNGNGGTVTFNGGSAQTIGGSTPTAFNNASLTNASGATLSTNATVNGALTLSNGVLNVASNTLTLNGGVSAASGTIGSAATGTVTYNLASNGQAVAPGTYGHLTFSNFTKTLSGLVKIAGTLTTGAAGGHTVTGSTVEFNGAGAQTIPSGFGTFNHLTINNASGVTGGGDVVVNGTLTLTSGAFNVAASRVLTIANPLAGTASNLHPNALASIVIGGSAAGVNLPSNVTALAGLTLANLSGTTLQANLAVSGALTLTSGVLVTGANTLALPTAAAVTRTIGYVNGNLKRTHSGGPFVYPVGTGNGYSPVTVNVTSGSGDLTVKATQGAQPNVNAGTALQRYWTLTGTGLTANLTFSYLDPSDIAGTEANYQIVKVSAGTRTFFANSCPTTSCVDPATNTATIAGVSSFSDWTLAAHADLSTTKSGPAGALAAGAFDYTATVTNNGPAPNTGGFSVADVLPAGVTFAAGGSDAGCSALGQSVTCSTVAGLANGATRAFVIHVTVGGGVANGTVLANTATAASTGTDDSNASNNASNNVSTTVLVPCNGCPFTDASLSNVFVKAQHMLELRHRIDVQRLRFGLAPYSWTEATLTPTVTAIRAQHLIDLRTALSDAYTAHALTPPVFTDPVPAGVTIKAQHIIELRNAVVTLEGS